MRGFNSGRAVVLFLLIFAGEHPVIAASALPPMVTDAASREAAAVLSDTCMKCHNATTDAAGINFATRESAGRAFRAASSGEMPLVTVVAAGRMPPDRKLPSAQIALLRRWAASGAHYPRPRLDEEESASSRAMRRPLWSLQPVRRPPVPRTPLDFLAQNPIDRFIFQRLLQRKLRPSPPADRLALIRRVTVDLTGLPPTTAEIAAFLNDHTPNAYEKVVDRLLASTAYGERWGRHWLDVVRYGESSGDEQNHLRPGSWPYRDYVIRAFNQDRPYTRFVADQLAGDVLAGKDTADQAATGFLVAGIHDTVGIQTEEGTRQQRANDLDDMVSTTGAAFLGLTVGCARCHDHKFDPIPQKDYYRLSAVFAGVRHGERPVATTPEQSLELREAVDIEHRTADATNQINALDASAREAVLKLKGRPAALRPSVSARRNVDDFPAQKARFVRFTILKTVDGAEPCLDELQVFGQDESQNLALSAAGAKATASSLLPGYAIHQVEHLNDGLFGNEHSWISNTPGSGWAQIQLPTISTVRRVVWSRDGGEIPRLDDRLPVAYRIELSTDGSVWRTVSTEAGRAGDNGYIHPEELLAAMSPEDRARRNSLAEELVRLHGRASQIEAETMVYAGQFTNPDPVFVLRRGDVMQRIDSVTPGTLSQVKEIPSDLLSDPAAPEPQRRLALASWITNPANPLTARVFVNRLWQYHFGRGIVGTTSDFGANGEKPTHPELLDWLASDFMAHGWRIKRMQKMMVMSYTYRQSSSTSPQALAVDAGNQLLWRMPLQRMEAEAIRDAILCASGKLDRRMGGPGFRLFRYSVVNVAIYEPLEEYGPDTWRRSVYTQTARGIQDGLLGKFDYPECSQSAPRRENTTTPLQALALLNGKFVVQQAAFFAERVRSEAGPHPADQVDRAFLIALGRQPTIPERQECRALLADRGLATLCRVLLNTNEFLYY